MNNFSNNQRNEIERLNNIIAEQQARINELNLAIDGMRNSTSWKLTAPIRGAKDAVKRIVKKDNNQYIVNESMQKTEIVINESAPVENEASCVSEEDLKTYVDYVMQIPFTGASKDEYEEKSKLEFQISEEDIKYIAFYLPQFHAFPENDEWWGKGFTEWTNVTKAVPQFSGHYQPRLAGELGYYDLSDGRKIKEQINLAKQFGLYGFCIYYYWFDGKKLMEGPLNYILDNPDLEFPFCICWANENWSRRWDGKETDILIQQNYNDDFPEKFIEDTIVYLKDQRYIKVDGKPLFVIYNPNQIPNLKSTISYWREYCRDNGIGEICLAAVDFALNEESRNAGFDRYIQFPPHSTYFYDKIRLNDQLNIVDKDYQGEIYDYQEIVDKKEYLKTDYSDMYPGVMLGWDNTARKKNSSTVYHNYSPKAFKEWLGDVSNIAMHKQPSDRVVFINAWNEWAEGTYLEPDRCYGYGALNAMQSCAIECSKSSTSKKIIYVSHDAWFNGAQMLALNTIKYLSNILGYKVYTVVKETGELEQDFREVSEQYVIYKDFSTPKEFENWVLSTGCNAALCNTVVSGDIVPVFKKLGLKTVTSIHEMENVIHQYNSESNLACIIENSDKIVFPSKYVIDSVNKIQSLPNDRTLVMHQGMFLINPYLENRKAIGAEVRKEYGISEKDNVIIGVGYGYKRKGLDLFVKAGLKLCEDNNNLKLMWVGDIEENMKGEIDELLTGNIYRDRFVFTGSRKDLMRYYCAADIFWLTSREDPFPSVIMEAMYSYLPIVAFNNGGGYVEVVKENTGTLVTMESVDELAEETQKLLSNSILAENMGKAAHEFAEKEFDFGQYVINLLALANEELPKVSVVIPNYNYEKYLPSRIDSVIEQTYPIYEIIVLDDCSTDDSVSVIDEYCSKYPNLIRSIKNEVNSGSVFEQWRRGIEACSGDYIWIAEADDLCDKNMISQLIKKFLDDSSVVMAYSQSEMIDENGNKLGDNYFCYTDDVDSEIWKNDYVIDAHREIEEHLAVKNTIPNVSAVLFKNMSFGDILDKAKEYKVAGDWYVYLEVMSSGGKVAYCSESMNKHRRHTNSVTSDLKLERHFNEICDIQDIIAGKYNKGKLSVKAKEYREKVREDFGLSKEE